MKGLFAAASLAGLLALAPLALAALAAPATAAPAAGASYATGRLTIGGETFEPAEVLDARALPDINGKVGIMVTLTPPAARRLEGISGSLVGQPMLVALDGTSLASELVRKPITDGVVEIPGRWTLSEGEALARRISGKDPVPDDL